MLAQRPPRSGKPAKQLALLLHGWGADGANLIDLADMLGEALPDAHFIAPNAPEVCEVNPYGFQWFSLMDRTPSHMLAGAERASEWLNKFIDEQKTALLPPPPSGGNFSASPPFTGEKEGENNPPIIFIGFSQGTMLALHVALRRSDIVAVAGFSGALLASDAMGGQITHRPPVCLIHGQLDDVVPYAAMGYAEVALNANGVSVETHTRPNIGHSIDMEGIAIAAQFLKGVIK